MYIKLILHEKCNVSGKVLNTTLIFQIVLKKNQENHEKRERTKTVEVKIKVSLFKIHKL